RVSHPKTAGGCTRRGRGLPSVFVFFLPAVYRPHRLISVLLFSSSHICTPPLGHCVSSLSFLYYFLSTPRLYSALWYRATASQDSSRQLFLAPTSMAAIVESVAAPRAPSGLRRSSCPVTATASMASVSSGPLPECRGLKMSWRPARFAPVAASALRSSLVRRGAVVCEAPDAAVEVPVVTKSTWQSLVLEADQLVVVAFWAPWCGPCRMIHPIMAEIAALYPAKLKCYELNTDENPDVASQYGIQSIPTVLFFKGGKKKDAILGAVPQSTLIASVEKCLDSEFG
ncbi:hypothetical protein Taro_046239, partial [Colocasia esculenta]|nr:hypothetical protein [Colocasia esculenta]